MPIKTFKPYTPSRRTITVADFSEITNKKPLKTLTKGLRKSGGRNNTGMIMTAANVANHNHTCIISTTAFPKTFGKFL